MNKAQNQINDMEHKEAKTNRSELQEEKRIPKYVVSVSSPWDNFKRSNIRIIGIPEGEENEKLEVDLNYEKTLP